MKKDRIIVVLLTIMANSTILSQDSNHSLNSPNGAFDWIYSNLFLIIASIAIVAVIWTLLRMNFVLLSIQKARVMQEMGMAKEEVLNEITESTWSKLYKWAWSIVPISEESDIDLGHDYDGIRELDNKLPPWWLLLFYGSIIFAGVYMYNYHRSDSTWSSEAEYYASVKAAHKKIKENLARQANAVDESNVTALMDENTLLVGESIYFEKCAVCHGQKGEGLVGPNFTDEYWVHGGGAKNIFKTIKYGVPEKGMISWQSQLRPAEMQAVTSYVLSLVGTNPPNGKAPEGELWVATSEDGPSGSSDEDASSINTEM